MKKVMLMIVFLTLCPALSQAGLVLSRIQEVRPNFLTEMNGEIYFSANDTTTGIALWKSDGTRGGTKIVKSFDTGAAYNNDPSRFLNANGTLYFCAYESASGWELWKSDGTESGTKLVTELYPGPNDGVSGNNCQLAYLDSKVFFGGIDATNGSALWKTDGTAGNTVMVHDLQPSNIWGIPQELFVMNNTLFFVGNDAIHGDEWWKCEGPAYDSASIVADINDDKPAGVSGGTSNKPVVLGSYFYFQGNNGTDGNELWRSNGTGAGTEMVKDINTSGSGSSSDFTVVDGNLFFTANNGTNGQEIWKSDGIPGGITIQVKDINGSGGSNPYYLTSIGTSLYFSADDGINGAEVWKSDGTDSGTVMIKDINTSGDGDSAHFIEFENEVYFRADDGARGEELWKTDGTVGNASLVANIAPGSDSSWPSGFLVFNDSLFFRATYNNNVPEDEGDALFRYGEKTQSLYWPMYLQTIINNAKQ